MFDIYVYVNIFYPHLESKDMERTTNKKGYYSSHLIYM